MGHKTQNRTSDWENETQTTGKKNIPRKEEEILDSLRTYVRLLMKALCSFNLYHRVVNPMRTPSPGHT